MKEKMRPKFLFTAVLVILALLSHFVVADYLSSPSTYADTIVSLEEKQSSVLELTATTTAASAAVTLLPGDVATPIADRLADLSVGFLIVLCAIYLEKYLLTIIGYVSFAWLIPAALTFLVVDAFIDWEALKKLGSKLLVFGILISLVIPSSVQVSDIIDATYRSSIDAAIEDAKQVSDEIENEVAEAKKENKGFISKITNEISEAASSIVKKAVDTVNRFLEALAVMLVTSCLIPILVLLIFVWLINITFSSNLVFGFPKSLPWKKERLGKELEKCE